MMQLEVDRRIADRLIPLCLYDPTDLGSFAAAAIVWNKYAGAVLCEPVTPHWQPKADLLGRQVIVLGPLYDPDILVDMAERAVHLLWITVRCEHPLNDVEHNVTTFQTKFDLATTAWIEYNPNEPYPGILQAMHSQDFGSLNAILINKGQPT